jgi:dimethylamine corrinoid protein
MTRSKEQLFGAMIQAVLDMESEKVVELSQEAIASGIDALEALNGSLIPAMNILGKKYELKEIFVPELLMCSESLMAGIEVLKPHIKASSDLGIKLKVVLGTVEGDVHCIGKNIVALMLEANGFEVHNLGSNIPKETFIAKVREHQADVVAISALMTTTMNEMKDVISLLEKEGLRSKVKVIVGGAPVSQKFSDLIKADGYAENAVQAVKMLRDLLA